MIVLEELTKRFGTFTAVDGIGLSVPKGQVLGFLGPNGAGKSTTMKMVTGYLSPSAGRAEVGGFDVVAQPMAVKRIIGYLPEGAPTYGDMRVAAFLDFIAEVRGFDGAERAKRVDRAVDLADLGSVRRQLIDTLSKGFKRRVGLAQAILHDPDVLIMDEPTDGLDPNQKHHVRSLIKEMAAEKAIVISTHILEEVEAVCSRAVIIDQGRLVADGTPDDLIARAPNHNAVVLRLDTAKAATLEAALKGIEGVDGVTLRSFNGDKTELRVLPKAGATIAIAVGDLVRGQGVQPDEMYVERGALDDVFRAMTASKGTTPRAPVGGEGAGA